MKVPASSLQWPSLLLFDWHGTLVDTTDAMYQTIEEMLLMLEDLGLVEHLIPEQEAKTPADENLIRYIRIYRHLLPSVLAERRISRTDIFDAIFGDNETALAIAHKAYDDCYAHHLGAVVPFQEGIADYLTYFRQLGIKTGIVTNRSRVYLDQELALVEGGRWQGLFDVILCGNQARRYKPAPEPLQEAAAACDLNCDDSVWFVGDSVTDMATAANAGTTAVFYNGAFWEQDWFERMFGVAGRPDHAPDLIVESFDALVDTLDTLRPANVQETTVRPPRHPRSPLVIEREEPDWHPALARLTPPKTILFDWHATLVDTLDAMYHAVDDMLKELRETGLLEHLVDSADCKSPEDSKLVDYVRENLQLHPKIKLDRKISRTDIFEVLFGNNEAAKQVAHAAFTRHYRKYYGTALPFEPKVRRVLEGLQTIGLRLGVITNRDREFFTHELANVGGEDWSDLFEVTICGDDTEKRKPHPDQILLAARQMGVPLDASVWYVGDSTTDVFAAKTAGITSVFFNGALWDLAWLRKIFPGNARYPHKPDVVVNDFSEFWAMTLATRHRLK